MFQKIFTVVEVISPNGTKSYYGKGKKEILINEDFGWHVKEYGCESTKEASKLQKQLKLYFKKLDIKWKEMNLKDCKMLFTDEDAERIGLR